jgi:hypothetical protein
MAPWQNQSGFILIIPGEERPRPTGRERADPRRANGEAGGIRSRSYPTVGGTRNVIIANILNKIWSCPTVCWLHGTVEGVRMTALTSGMVKFIVRSVEVMIDPVKEQDREILTRFLKFCERNYSPQETMRLIVLINRATENVRYSDDKY